jgi:4-amino-4-deoxychorismate lyase
MISIPDYVDNSVFKCRILYGKSVESVTFEKYIPKKVETLRLVDFSIAETFLEDIRNSEKGRSLVFDNYKYKYQNRELLNYLLNCRNDADDILIVKDGYLTDTSFSNIVLFKNGIWYTPDTFLLNGTCRQRLLHDKKIKEISISVDDLDDYDEIRLINAMIDIEQARIVKIKK